MKKTVLAIVATGGILAGCTPMRSVSPFEVEGAAKARPTMELEPELDTDWGIALGKSPAIPARVEPAKTPPPSEMLGKGPTAKTVVNDRGK